MPVTRFASGAKAADVRSLTPEPPSAGVAEIIAAVRSGGDAAVAEIEARFGPAEHSGRVAPELIDGAAERIEPQLRAALELAIANVRAVAAASPQDEQTVELPQGQSVTVRSMPVARAAAYVPGGRGSYPSTAVMTLATAREAGVEDLCVVSPARDDGRVDAAVLAVCDLLGVSEVHALGGAQGVAAVALGTESIRAADVVVGPGNAWVQEAKRQLVGEVGIDSVAGPSELVVIADASADPQWVAADLQAQAEHGPDSLVVLLSCEPEVCDAVAAACTEIPAELAVVECAELDQALALAEAIAPEHLQLMLEPEEAERLQAEVRRAGATFVGHNAATAFGDYVAGSNHVLPTGGAAAHASALSTSTFRRKMSVVRVPDRAVAELAEAGGRLARSEGFSWHARSMEDRQRD